MMASSYTLSFIILSTLLLLPHCFTQKCKRIKCRERKCPEPIKIPGKCCPVCPPKGKTAATTKCPRADITLPCGDSCRFDTDCVTSQKCCDHGCGRSCRSTVKVSSAECPFGVSKPSTDCDKLSGIPCPVGYSCKHSLSAGSSECCPTAEFKEYSPHPCEHAFCSRLHCTTTRIPQGRCCPECVPEELTTPVPVTPAEQPPQQTSYCSTVQCPQVTCINPTPSLDGCCQVCPKVVPATPAVVPPAVVKAASSPGNAATVLQNMMCMFSFCQAVACAGSYIPPGECCNVCPDPCANVACPTLACTTAFKPEGQCCPTCHPVLTCYFNNQVYQQGQGFQNDCNNCTCSEGYVYCTNITCEQQCHHNGQPFKSGATVFSTACQTCNCNNGVIYCSHDICATPAPQAATPAPRAARPALPPRDPCSGVVCATVSCAVTYQPNGKCCPICLNPGECLYAGNMYKNGAVKKEICKKCTCMDGLMVCANECLQGVTSTIRTPPKVYQPTPPKEYQPTPPKEYQPTPPKVYQPTPPKVYQPTPPEVYQPTPPKVYQPTPPEVYQPTPPKVYQPALPKVYQPTLPKFYQPTPPGVYQPTPPEVYQPAPIQPNQMYQQPQQVYQLPRQQQQHFSSEVYQPPRQQQHQPTSQVYQPAWQHQQPNSQVYEPPQQQPLPPQQQPYPQRPPSPPYTQQPTPKQSPPPPPPPAAENTPIRGPPPRPPPPSGPPSSRTQSGLNTIKPPLLVQTFKDLHVPKDPNSQQQDPLMQVQAYPNELPNPNPPRKTAQTKTNGQTNSLTKNPPPSEVYQTFPDVKTGKRPPLQAFEQIPQNQIDYQSPPRGPYTPTLTGTSPPSMGQFTPSKTGPKSSADQCRSVNCPIQKCPDYTIPPGECCPVCKNHR